MKLPNGYGTITKLSGTRRRPYIVKSKGIRVYDPKIKGYKQTRSMIGYAATKAEALSMLAAYNDNPYDTKYAQVTFEKLWELWKKKGYDGLSQSSINCKELGFRYCEPIQNMQIKEIKTQHIQECIDSCPRGSNTKKLIKTVCHHVFEYAMMNDIVSKDYTEYVKIDRSEPVIDRIPFSDNEVRILWQHVDRWDVQIVLILLYSGMRVNELLLNTKDHLNIEDRTLYISDAKNKQSVRYVPIHEAVFPLLMNFYDRATDKLMVNPNGTVVAYNNFAVRNLQQINELLEVKHKMHDTRHTFITWGHRYDLDELCLKRIVGHTAGNIKQDTYTHTSVEELHKELTKIPKMPV